MCCFVSDNTILTILNCAHTCSLLLPFTAHSAIPTKCHQKEPHVILQNTHADFSAYLLALPHFKQAHFFRSGVILREIATQVNFFGVNVIMSKKKIFISKSK